MTLAHICQVQLKKSEDLKIENNTKCELTLGVGVSPEICRQVEMLVDDEELELSQIQAVSEPSSCCHHFAANWMQGCSLCKGLFCNSFIDLSFVKSRACVYILFCIVLKELCQ